MGKYNSYVTDSREVAAKRKAIHPIWRGIGFIMFIAVPFFSYIGALVIFQQNQTKHWFPIPADILSPWGSDPYIFVKLAITIVLIVAISAVLTSITFVVYGMFGPPRYGPQDSPPVSKYDKPKYSRR
jgi:hypothetical protein